jgi:phosphoglycolate phosphatase-like HAD superfamily hydrolase
MAELAGTAVIFDVDGVLLDLTAAEEDAFFLAFEGRYGITGLSRDWDSYKIRNDEHIIAEILEAHGLPAKEKNLIVTDYLAILSGGIAEGTIATQAIAGAAQLIRLLNDDCNCGIATANLLSAAKIRLESQSLWHPVSHLAFGAEGSGHKRETVARAISATGLPKQRIVYIGDNLNDVEAGLSNGVHFIGFSSDPVRMGKLKAAGATHLSGDHGMTRDLICRLLE